ncbi:Pre-mRNA-splicing factor cwc24 [Cyphellophora attinorum]|uniref:Pre-mRNA-splicing factor CWC24 n=1 Tax=Cyphellophora attinorum TaxID=1664694 RepID=A0A0N1P1K9_9EURO|nr:Pre-mRNA-splicing factor cwc24 [Phialophora attinorum]KPI42286.1 Pre-mRNA-splicing factor cwc24 [Phialophora attinorum]
MADTEVADVPLVSFKKRGAKAKANLRKREPTPPAQSDSDSGFTSSEDEGGRAIKRRKTNATVTASSTNNNSSRLDAPAAPTTKLVPQSLTTKDDATKTADWYDESSTGKPTTKSSSTKQDGADPDGTYRGLSSYSNFITTNPDRHIPKTAQIGPQKNASSNVRTITVTDFAPDVCKDYKQTGFCGFGDSCKFLHAREAYSQGWQLDREWEINTKGKKLKGRTVASAAGRRNGGEAEPNDDGNDDALLESIPFACIICKESYKSPIVTKCGHYFCEACALKRYRRDPSCAACGTGTGGVFNVAKKLNKLLDRKKERERERELEKQKADAEGA